MIRTRHWSVPESINECLCVSTCIRKTFFYDINELWTLTNESTPRHSVPYRYQGVYVDKINKEGDRIAK